MRVNKDILAEEILIKLGYEFPIEDLKLSISIIFDILSETLANKDRIEIRGFGTFSLRNRLVPIDPRKNKEKGGKKVVCNSVYFRMAKKMSDQLKYSATS